MRRGDLVWTPDKEVVRGLLVLEKKTRKEIIAEGDHSQALVDKTIYMMEHGLAPPLEPIPPEPGDNISQEISEGYGRPQATAKLATKKKESVQVAASFGESNLLRIVPRTFTTSSLLIFLAMEIAKREWGWNLTDPGEFLDRFIIVAMEEFGFKLAGYIKGPDASVAPIKGNGHIEVEQEPPAEEEEEEEIIFTGEQQ